ncbi:MAG: hypothetical protein J5I98_32650, partial [Phaeodactylibacter sp.]|nr:hypothetical protein [Phaeodactylibacter sp.]
MLAGLFLLSAAGPARGQAVFRGEILEVVDRSAIFRMDNAANGRDWEVFALDFQDIKNYVDSM